MAEHVAAVVRFRPLPPGVASAFNINFDTNAVTTPENVIFNFTKVYGESASTATVFENSVKNIVDEVLGGKNGCALCYGQTESGKTHTTFGYDEPGLVPLAIKHIFAHIAQFRRTTRFRIAMSFYEVYNETVNDLLNPSGVCLSIREASNGVAFPEGLSIRMCDDLASTLRLISYGNENKTIGNSYLHDKSSRAHTVVTIQVASERKIKNTMTTQLSRLNFVDLAGSEMLSYNFGEEQQKETKAINLSLLSLRNVVTALAVKENFIPFRDSVLTRLLAPSLGLNAVTTVISTCSGMPVHASITLGTLRFGNISGSIEQRAKLNEFTRKSGKLKLKDKADEVALNVEEATKKANKDGETFLAASAAVATTVFETRQGSIQGFIGTPKEPVSSRIALCLHAYGTDCSGRDWFEVFNPLCALGFTCYSITFPGFGGTAGMRQTSRTDRLDENGGPLEIVYDVLEIIAGRQTKVLFVGWDWGANMALSLAISAYKARIAGLVLYHPSWTSNLDLLHSIAVPVLLLWIPSDQLHLFSTGRKMAKLIRKSKLVSLAIKPGQERNYNSLWKLISQLIFDWVQNEGLIAAKPKPALPLVVCEEKESSTSEDESDSGADLDDEDWDTISTQSSFLACILCDPLCAAEVVQHGIATRKLTKKKLGAEVGSLLTATREHPTFEKAEGAWALEQVANLLNTPGALAVAQDALLRRNGKEFFRSDVLKLLTGLPQVRPQMALESLLPFWPTLPRGSPYQLAQYTPGRTVIVPVPNICMDMRKKTFGFASEQSSTPFLTFRATISSKSTAKICVVEVPTSPSAGSLTCEHTLSWATVYAWNEPTVFPTRGKDSVVFEDAIVCRYSEIVTRLKFAEIALKLAPIAGSMDFEAAVEERLSGASTTANKELLCRQIQAVKTVRGCMNMIHMVNMGKDPKRFCVPDVGRLATFGQWHCHGMASVMASLLLPFCAVLGIEVRFRDGFFHSPERDGPSWDGAPRPVADHTWLELTFLPSGLSCVCDPSFDDQTAVNTLKSYDDVYCSMFPVRDLTSALPKSTGEVTFSGKVPFLPLNISLFL